MTEWIQIATIDQVPPGKSIEVTVADRVFAVFNVEGTIHILDGICPHAGGPLGKGTLSGNLVTCPWHGWQFDVSTGRHCLSPSIAQQHFPVRVDEGRILVSID